MYKQKVELFRMHAMKACRRRRGISPHIRGLCTRWFKIYGWMNEWRVLIGNAIWRDSHSSFQDNLSLFTSWPWQSVSYAWVGPGMSDVRLACYLRFNRVGELALCCLECRNRFRGNTGSNSNDMNTRMSFKPELISNLISLIFSNKKVGITCSFH